MEDTYRKVYSKAQCIVLCLKIYLKKYFLDFSQVVLPVPTVSRIARKIEPEKHLEKKWRETCTFHAIMESWNVLGWKVP